MPNRWLRDSILASRILAELSDFAERLFFRLLVVSDDFGRFNSDPAIVRSVCFPLRTDAIKCARIEKALDELIRSGIARFYLAVNKVIGELVNFTKFQHPSAEIESNEHPTSKPNRLIAIPMELHTSPNDLCYEPFSGSGSQLVAAEQLGRRRYAIELEPRFVDVAISRWEKLTGQKAEVVEEGAADENTGTAANAD